MAAIEGCNEVMTPGYRASSRTTTRVRPGLLTATAMATLLLAGTASAVDYPVTGSLTFNENPADLPDGSLFVGSSYDDTTGEIGTGSFVFPQATLSFTSSLGDAEATYQITQDNTSSGQVGSDSTAALTESVLTLTMVSLTIDGSFPFDVGTCVFSPITLELAGTASATGLSLMDAAFTVPTVGPEDCGGFSSDFNNAISGSNNEIALQVVGDFTPPAGDNDTIFKNGFETP